MTDLQTQVDQWKTEGYLTTHRGTLVLTQKFYETLGQAPPPKAPGDNKEKFQEFIKLCEVPYRLPIGNKGETYTVNAYSKPGMEAFVRALKQPGMDYSRLVAATKAHYADPRASRKTISNYFIQEWWVSVYQEYNSSSVPTHLQTFNIEL